MTTHPSALPYHLMRLIVAHVLHQAGFEATLDSAHFALADIFTRYVDLLAIRTKTLAEHQGRTVANLDDLASAFDTLDISIEELVQFCVSSLEIGAENTAI